MSIRDLLCAAVLACAAALPAVEARAAAVDFRGEDASADARTMAQWIGETGDNHGMPFAIVDKKSARLFVFAASGRLSGAAPALLGLASGDHSVPGIGDRPMTQILPAERTTPAGRFASEPGRNLQGEDLVWLDYDAALAIHRLRPSPAREHRSERLISPDPADHRVSYGCVIVDPAFYDSVVRPTLGRHRGIVYVLPETRSVQAMLADSAPAARRH
jgi:hypothetical protein